MKSQSNERAQSKKEEAAEEDQDGMLVLDADEGELERLVKENQDLEFVFKRVALLIQAGVDPMVAANRVAQEIKDIESGAILSEEDVDITEV